MAESRIRRNITNVYEWQLYKGLRIRSAWRWPSKRVNFGQNFDVRFHLALLIVNGLFIGAGIFANLAFEVIGLDLYVVALLAALAFGLLWRRGAQPLFVYYATAYGVGLATTFLYKAIW